MPDPSGAGPSHSEARGHETGPRLVIQSGHGGPVTAGALSPDGALAVTAGSDQLAVLWTTTGGHELRRFEGHEDALTSIAFSSSGREVLTGSVDGTARVWDVTTGEELRRVEQPGRGVVTAVALSASGSLIATGLESGSVFVWDAIEGDARSVQGQYGLEEWEVGRELRRFAPHEGAVRALAFSPDDAWVLAVYSDQTVGWLPLQRGSEKTLALEAPPGGVVGALFREDDSAIVHGWDREGRSLWTVSAGGPNAGGPSAGSREAPPELRSLEILWRDDLDAPPTAVVLKGERLLVGRADGTAALWDLGSEPVQRFRGLTSRVTNAVFSPDGGSILTGTGSLQAHETDEACLWSTETGRLEKRLPSPDQRPGDAGELSGIYRVAFSSDGARVVTGGPDLTTRVWDTDSGMELLRVPHPELSGKGVSSLVTSPVGRAVLTGGPDAGARLWSVRTRRHFRHAAEDGVRVTSVAFSADGASVLTGGTDGRVRVWSVETGEELDPGPLEHPDAVTAVACSPVDGAVLTGCTDGFARLWPEGSIEPRAFGRDEHSDAVTAVAFSPDGSRMLTGSGDGTTHLWDSDTTEQIHCLEGHADRVWSVAFSPNQRFVLTTDMSARLWSVESGKEICRLVSFLDGTWVVVTPTGVFDTNNLELSHGLHWVMPDDPMTPLPVQVFLRDYFEPRLLPRLMAGETFPETEWRGLSDRNRVQPEVRIADVKPTSARPPLVEVRVEVTSVEREVAGKLKQSGVFDLRLFRDGQVVPPRPVAEEFDGSLGVAPGERRTITFSDVAVPAGARPSSSAGGAERTVEFSAYAFNDDGVKGPTDYASIRLPDEIEPREGLVYLISIGVDKYAHDSWDLEWPSRDARSVQRVVRHHLEKRFGRKSVVCVPLYSDEERRDATKANVKTVLELLAGKTVDEKRKKAITDALQGRGETFLDRRRTADLIQEARPEDLVLITVSCHGVRGDGKAGDEGEFYLLMSDLDCISLEPCWKAGLLDEKGISSAALARWLREVDAGEIALIIGACHSAASVENEGFKPAPMESRGLGQLAYDKGMLVLAATQAADEAFEDALIQGGLLTYALVNEGLEAGHANFRPPTDRISLVDWLSYGVERVPRLLAYLQGAGRLTKKPGQQPALFDFRKRQDEVLLWPAARKELP